MAPRFEACALCGQHDLSEADWAYEHNNRAAMNQNVADAEGLYPGEGY